jgi:hypothetical protein
LAMCWSVGDLMPGSVDGRAVYGNGERPEIFPDPNISGVLHPLGTPRRASDDNLAAVLCELLRNSIPRGRRRYPECGLEDEPRSGDCAPPLALWTGAWPFPTLSRCWHTDGGGERSMRRTVTLLLAMLLMAATLAVMALPAIARGGPPCDDPRQRPLIERGTGDVLACKEAPRPRRTPIITG